MLTKSEEKHIAELERQIRVKDRQLQAANRKLEAAQAQNYILVQRLMQMGMEVLCLREKVWGLLYGKQWFYRHPREK